MNPFLFVGVYLLIGLLYANKELNDIIAESNEGIDENDENDKEYIKERNNFYDQLHEIHKVMGDKSTKAMILIVIMVFWLPLFVRFLFYSIKNYFER